MTDSIRQKAIKYALARLDEIDATYTELSEKSSQWRKAANKIHRDLTQEIDGKPVIAQGTYHRYLTDIRNAVKDTGRKHPALVSPLNRKGYLAHAVKNLPTYERELNALASLPASTIGNGKAMLKEQLHSELKGGALDAAIEIVDGLLIDHPFVMMLTKSKARKEARAKAASKTLSANSQHMKRYNYHALLKLASECLNDESYTSVAWGLAVATGRRAGEILHFAKFQKIDDSTLLFSGQLKKRQGTQTEAYPIPCLLPADDVLAAFERFRNMPEVSVYKKGAGKYHDQDIKYSQLPKHKLTIAINQRVSGVLNARAKRLMDDPSEQFKNTRGIYARYCSDVVRVQSEQWKGYNEDEFLKAILGHESTDEVKHYRQVSLAFEAESEWLKDVVEAQGDAEAESKPQTKAKQNWRATSPIKALRDALDAYQGEWIELGSRRVNIETVKDFHDKKLRFWVAENPSMKITQSAIEKNKGNTASSGTGTVDVRVNRNTFQAWLKVVGDEAIEAFNANKD